MNEKIDLGKHANVDNNLTKDQLAELGIETDPSGTDVSRSEVYQKDLAEEAKWLIPAAKPDANQSASETKNAEAQSDGYYDGLSQ